MKHFRPFLVVLLLGSLLLGKSYGATITEVLTLGTLTVNTNGDAGATGDTGALFTLTSGSPANFNGGHFNWLNIVESGSANFRPRDPTNPAQRVNFPWVDPLDGGSFGFGFNDPADHLPFYWDEGAPLTAPLTNHINGNVLDFFDHPSSGTANTTADFDTYLVFVKGPIGQTANRTFDVLAGWDWTFTENATGTGELAITNLAFFGIDDAELAEINGALQQPYNFPAWRAVPAPESSVLLVVGLLLVVLRLRYDRYGMRKDQRLTDSQD